MQVAGGELEGERQAGLQLVVAQAQPVDDRLRGFALGFDAGGLVVEQLVADLVLVVLGQELALLGLERGEQLVAAGQLLLAGAGEFGEVLLQGGHDSFAVCLAEVDGAVVLLDGGLDRLDALRTLLTAAALVADADEVGVDAAVAAVAGVGQPAAAVVAEDRALEVVRMLAVALAALVVRFEHGLHLVEQLLADDRRVPAGVLLAAVGHDPDVVGVGEQVMHGGVVQRLGGVAAAAAAAQPASGQQSHHVVDRVEAGGVGLKAPGDDRRALGIDGDRADFAALRQLLADVEVAELRASRRAAALGLLGRALDDLVCQVAAVVLGEAGEHPVHQPTGRCLVDVLGRADESRAGQLDLKEHVGVIAPVAREAIDFPEDHVVHVAALLDASQHRGQRRPIVGLG